MARSRRGDLKTGAVPSVERPPEQGHPLRRAVALGYEADQDIAPRVLASGQGVLADRIVELARQAGVPILADPALARALASVELESAIPPELYAIVAEVLMYVYRVQGRLSA